MRVLIVTVLLFLMGIPSVYAGNLKSGDVRMFLDYARFRYDEQDTYLEIYYMLYDLREEALRTPETIWLEFKLSDQQKDSVLAQSRLKAMLGNESDPTGEMGRVRGSLIKTVLPAGKYMIKMVRLGEDGVQRLDSLDHSFATAPFSGEKLTLSDLELCANLIPGATNKKGLFYKNTMEVVPNPMRMYGPQTSKLFFYVELYNALAQDPTEEIQIQTAIADRSGDIKAQKNYTRKRNSESLVEFGSFDVADLDNGLYTLVFAATDPKSNYSVYRRNNFFIMDPNDLSEQQDDVMALFPQSPYFNMAESQVDERFDQIGYIITKPEMDIYKAFDQVEAKRLFMFRFWRERERTHPDLQREYYNRVGYANENFGFSKIPGWKSDRGRVYILYGEPDRINHNLHSRDKKPYDIWEYQNLEGGAKFLFVDFSGYGEYRLMSSTLRGEIYDPQWDNYLLLENDNSVPDIHGIR